MPFLSVHGLSFQLPDGRTLFHDIDLSFGPELTGLVGRNGVGKSCLLSILAGLAQPTAGGISGSGRVALLRQMADVSPTDTVADLFGAAAALDLLARIEAGRASVEEMGEADWTLDSRIDKALSDVGLSGTTPRRLLTSLSGGQRTRAALAALGFDEPDILLLDEPTNNLDREGRAMVHGFLERWKGGAVVVSHDRELLNRMDRIVELSTLGARVYGGGYDAYRQQRDAELASAEAALDAAERQARQVARAAQQARERQEKRDSAGRKARASSSDPKILLDAKQQRAEATAARGSRLASRLEADARDRIEQSRQAIERRTPFTAGIGDSDVPRGKLMLESRGLVIGFKADAPLKTLDLGIYGPERVAIVGPNGSGKSTLLKTIAGQLAPLAGSLRVEASLAYFDQHVGLLEEDASILDNYRRINRGASEFQCRSALARYAFRADAALQRVGTLSGGERLRAGLACVAAGERPPEMLILDEPTNHLDLDSIAEVEAGLNDFGGALLVVSHDETFLEAIGIERRVRLG
ncbi:ABC-F family ATP-binding cassette domain-containing protein [Mesorhizobium sp. CAU 1741]|uniref:ABC-F family ATP-binding cassette domain-containing protein n=1 Tax=Mesorhizobium sp. CAU 1741 TaxID=3140366 RepID=UPI00325BC07B